MRIYGCLLLFIGVYGYIWVSLDPLWMLESHVPNLPKTPTYFIHNKLPHFPHRSVDSIDIQNLS